MPKEIRDVMSPGSACPPSSAPIITIVTAGGELVPTVPKSPAPAEVSSAPIVAKEKSTEYPSATLNGEWDIVEPELYNMFNVVNVKKTLLRGKATVEMSDGTKLVYHKKKDHAGNVHWTRREKDILKPKGEEDSDSDDSDETETEEKSAWD
jgi:hypothetical protein